MICDYCGTNNEDTAFVCGQGAPWGCGASLVVLPVIPIDEFPDLEWITLKDPIVAINPNHIRDSIAFSSPKQSVWCAVHKLPDHIYSVSMERDHPLDNRRWGIHGAFEKPGWCD
jgi:hypothetical protein